MRLLLILDNKGLELNHCKLKWLNYNFEGFFLKNKYWD